MIGLDDFFGNVEFEFGDQVGACGLDVVFDPSLFGFGEGVVEEDGSGAQVA